MNYREEIKNKDFFIVPSQIWEDNRLNIYDRIVLTALFSRCEQPASLNSPQFSTTSINLENFPSEIGISRERYFKAVDNLKSYNWITDYSREQSVSEDDSPQYIYSLTIPDIPLNNYSSEIARVWTDYFGTHQLTPTTFTRIQSFVEDGIQEEVVIKAMEMSADRAQGNPINYLLSILNDFLSRGILTVSDLEEEKQRVKEYEQQISKNDREKETGTPSETLEELYKKGYE